MSVHVSAWAYSVSLDCLFGIPNERRVGPVVARAVLVKLADQANDAGAADPLIERLVRETELGERTVQRALLALELAGLIERERIFGRGRSSVYHLLLGGEKGCQSGTHNREKGARAAPLSAKGCQSGTHSGESSTDAGKSSTDGPSERKQFKPRIETRSTTPTGPTTPIGKIPTSNEVGAQELVGFYVDSLSKIGSPAPSRAVGIVARQVGELLGEGIDGEIVRSAISILIARRLHPSVLPTLIPEASAGPAARRGRERVADREFLRAFGSDSLALEAHDQEGSS